MLHNVYFWLKPGLSAEQIRLFEEELVALTRIAYLESGFCGQPAPTEPRPVTDHSFSYSLSLKFKTMADHDFYQKGCPDHQRFVDTCKVFFERVAVYDSQALA